MITEYIKLLFESSLICISICLILLFLLKSRIILKSNDDYNKNLVGFVKKLLVFAIIILPITLVIRYSNLIDSRKRIYNDKNDYINACMIDAQKAPYADSIKTKYIHASYDYLYLQHGDSIYFNDFKYSEHDKIELALILYFLTKPDLTEKNKIELRSQIKTYNDIISLMKK
jgi:hypothetical protein